MGVGERAAVREQAVVSAIVNAVLSAAIFILVFGLARRALSVEAPDQFALDFLPQGAILGFMSALVPALVVRNKMRKGQIAGAAGAGPSTARIALRALLLSLASVASAALAMVVLPKVSAESIEWLDALLIKIVFGVVLGVLVTRAAVRAVLR